MAVADDLAAYIEAAAARPFGWGRFDCQLFIAEWVLARTGKDPAAPWRGRYHTALGAKRILNRHGGPLGLLETGLGAVGLQRTDDPQAGDVGLLRAVTANGEAACGAIRLGKRWAGLRVGGGVFVAHGDALAAWRV